MALLPFAMLEFALAAVDFQFQPPIMVPMNQGRQGQHLALETEQFRAHPLWFWELRPGVTLVRGTSETANRFGFRGPAPAAQPPEGTTRIVALGDSSTFGVFMRDPQTWPRQLERRLPAEVLNFGVAGYSVFQGLELYRHKARRFEPAAVVIAFGAFNEAAPADPPAEERARVTQASANRILFHLDAALLRFRWYQLLRFAAAELRGEREIAERNMERYEENFARWEAGQAWRPEVDVESFGRLLTELVREARSDGARVLLVSPPRSPDMESKLPALLEYTRKIQAVGEQTGVPVCPVRQAFREAGEPLLLDSVHPTARGHQRYADVVAGCLRDAGIVGR